jgi:pyruvate dehydrogenase (quinone)
LTGDAAATLRALLPQLKPRVRGAWREKVERDVTEMWKEEEAKARIPADPLNPELFFWELTPRLPDDAVLTVDTGMSTTFFARAVRLKRGMKTAISGTLATMGPGVAYALAAKFAFPDRPAFAFVGDGAMQMLGLNGLITAAKYWKHWSDPRLVIAVLNNRDLNMVSWELRALGGAPKVSKSQELPDIDYAAQARLLGLEGFTVAGPADVGLAWDKAMAANRPIVLDVKADPNVIALPPHASVEQTKNLFMALARDDQDRGAILHQLYRQLVA